MATTRVQKKRAAYGTSMGVSSIIAILVILVLVVFSALSITTAKADLTLSQKTADSITAYYEADAKAESILAGVMEQIPLGTVNIDPEAFDFAIPTVADGYLLSFSVVVDEHKNLNVRVLIDANGQCHRQLWQVVPSGEWQADNDIKLFQ